MVQQLLRFGRSVFFYSAGQVFQLFKGTLDIHSPHIWICCPQQLSFEASIGSGRLGHSSSLAYPSAALGAMALHGMEPGPEWCVAVFVSVWRWHMRTWYQNNKCTWAKSSRTYIHMHMYIIVLLIIYIYVLSGWQCIYSTYYIYIYVLPVDVCLCLHQEWHGKKLHNKLQRSFLQINRLVPSGKIYGWNHFFPSKYKETTSKKSHYNNYYRL